MSVVEELFAEFPNARLDVQNPPWGETPGEKRVCTCVRIPGLPELMDSRAFEVSLRGIIDYAKKLRETQSVD